ncbi:MULTISPECIES: hypothetical protein [Saccharopolyspora]|nr:hypothetical protein [Saccharopolyspora elongata]
MTPLPLRRPAFRRSGAISMEIEGPISIEIAEMEVVVREAE